ncbi:hypothetical protein BKA61DRAFT_20403 [Leptodontidium sp. MPI-SDFR-AT-0119]|nr:hypothetical protein BKA61DRAFT_20403 [Leptodontidium sp. MPI-SDFR-AT-0119]
MAMLTMSCSQSFGQCCSTTLDYCGTPNGCQATFSSCTPVTTDGKCSFTYFIEASCAGSTFGECCSVKRNCSVLAAFCAIANVCQSLFGKCTPTSTDGKCGSASVPGASCIGSTFGDCCSIKGNCGSSAAFCAIDNLCQPNFGMCSAISIDGKCGPASASKASCTGSTFGICYLAKGNCGSSVAFCAVSNLC